MFFAQVPAPAKAPRDMLQSPNFVIALVVLVACLFVGAAVIHFVDRWRKRGQAHSRFAATLQLSDYREMYENGEITQGEYEKIRNRLANRMKKDVGLEAAPVELKPAPEPEPPAPPT